MEQEVVKKLLELNKLFYQNFSSDFSATRVRLQPGVTRILQKLPLNAAILDLGCGNCELWNALSRKGFSGIYVGMDSSDGLLEICMSRKYIGYQLIFINSSHNIEINEVDLTIKPIIILIQADLTDSHWDEGLNNISFDYIFAFALLHHLPGEELRVNILKKVSKLLETDGIFIHSEWQFLNSPRLRSRIQPWSEIGLNETQVDEGDYLVDWRRGGTGLRYVHHFSPAELNELSKVGGFKIIDEFYSDGENGNLGYYQMWKKTSTGR